MLTLLLCSLQTADAVPLQLTQQGRMVDSTGLGVEGTEVVFFRIYDGLNSGNLLWEEYVTLSFTNGYYAAVLGADVQNNPLDSGVLSLYPLYLELQLGGNAPLSPRTLINSTPYSQIAGVAESVEGGTVNTGSISIAGTPVIDGNGGWVGQPLTVDWSNVANVPGDIADGDANTQLSEIQVEGYVNNDAIDLHPSTTMNGSGLLTQADVLTPDWTNVTNRPAGLDDGDDDTLAGLGCSPGEIVGWDGVGWICTSDASLTESEVENYVTNGSIDLDAGSTIGGMDIMTSDDDTLAGLSCLDSEVARYDAISGVWFCAADALAQKVCGNGEVITYNTGISDWECTSFQTLLDADGDGVMAWADCDDTNPNVLSSANDADCDGTITSLDCDDNDPNSPLILTDGDCDGFLTADDCNDNDPNSNTTATDADCDGDLTTSDCNDGDPTIYNGATEVCNDGIDQDCDGSDDLSCLQLYSFSGHTFTPCGASGWQGPSLSSCQSAYSSEIWASNTSYYTVNNGVQEWIVPETGSYRIMVRGAQGGENHCGDNGGLGAEMAGDYTLQAGTVLKMVVGHIGVRSSSGDCANGGGGGGGGSFIWVDGDAQPLIAAGGGGGSGLTNNGGSNYIGMDATSAVDGTAARDGSAGGTNGGDGNNGGGKGWYSVLSNPEGVDGSSNTYNGTGGFGGGGRGGNPMSCGNNQHSPGAGGGYSGGGATTTCFHAGGGGGSYIAGYTSLVTQNGGAHSGDGQINITKQ